MSPIKLIILRLFGLSFGRIPFCAVILKRILIFILIKKQNKVDRYVASSNYFDHHFFFGPKGQDE